MNPCCRKTIARLQIELANLAETLVKTSGQRQSVMEEACYRRAEIIADIMDTIRDLTNKGKLE